MGGLTLSSSQDNGQLRQALAYALGHGAPRMHGQGWAVASRVERRVRRRITGRSPGGIYLYIEGNLFIHLFIRS